MVRLRCLPPIVDDNTRVLILGSFPGEQSLKRQQYYGHPQNHFWQILGRIIGQPLSSMTYPEKVAALRRHHIGIWDIYASCYRAGSLDANIKKSKENDVVALLAKYPRISSVIFNGKRAGAYSTRIPSSLRVFIAPSTSPAYTIPIEEKYRQWAIALREHHE